VPEKTNLDRSNLPAEDPELVQFAGIFGRYFYGQEWLDGELYVRTPWMIGFPTVLQPKDVRIPLKTLAKMFRHYLLEGTQPNPKVLMSNLTMSSQFKSSLHSMDGLVTTGPGEEIREALKQHLYESFCAALEEYRIRNPEKLIKRKKPGVKADRKIKERAKIVRKHMKGKHKSAFYDPDIFHALLSELDYEKISFPIFGDGTTFEHPWVEVQDDPDLKERVIKLLNEDQFQRRKR